ncbi:MAG: tripartite tricarboxylate transporter TctB family protein [Pontibacterium sp.]
MSESTAKKPGESLFGLLMLAFSIALFWQAYEISGFTSISSPGAFPLAVAAIMIIASCNNILKDLKRPSGNTGAEPFFTQILPPIVAIMIAVIFIFGILLETLGFVISAFAFLVVSIQFLHQRGIVRTILLSLLALTVIYVIFRLIFSVILPEGIVPEREIMAWLSSLFK